MISKKSFMLISLLFIAYNTSQCVIWDPKYVKQQTIVIPINETVSVYSYHRGPGEDRFFITIKNGEAAEKIRLVITKSGSIYLKNREQEELLLDAWENMTLEEKELFEKEIEKEANLTPTISVSGLNSITLP